MLDNSSLPVPVRPELTEAQEIAWERLSRAGSWWSAAARIAIVEEARKARSCSLCQERKQALSPFGGPGRHLESGLLPAPYVDAVHRIVTDPGRLTQQWLDGLRDEGLEDGPYIELVGVLVTSLCVDVFYRTLGLPVPELPDPESGEPTRASPEEARKDVAWVPLVPPELALDTVYDGNPITPYVRQALSLVPDEMRNLVRMEISHYLPLEAMRRPGDNAGRALDRMQLEFLAARVSYLHDCFY